MGLFKTYSIGATILDNSNTAFVSSTAGLDTNTGTRQSPVATITKACTLGKSIVLCKGNFTENLTINSSYGFILVGDSSDTYLNGTLTTNYPSGSYSGYFTILNFVIDTIVSYALNNGYDRSLALSNVVIKNSITSKAVWFVAVWPMRPAGSKGSRSPRHASPAVNRGPLRTPPLKAAYLAAGWSSVTISNMPLPSQPAKRRCQLKANPMKLRKSMVDQEWSEAASGDGYWISLKSGFCWDGDPCGAVHCIHEDTKAKAWAEPLRRCNCVDCKPAVRKPLKRNVIELDCLLHGNPTQEQVSDFFRHGDFHEERYLVAAIRKHLLTELQKDMMRILEYSIEDILNGRVDRLQSISAKTFFKVWNQKLGFNYFLAS